MIVVVSSRVPGALLTVGELFDVLRAVLMTQVTPLEWDRASPVRLSPSPSFLPSLFPLTDTTTTGRPMHRNRSVLRTYRTISRSRTRKVVRGEEARLVRTGVVAWWT